MRPEHAALNGVTLPPSDDFWESYYPPNGWRCRCTVVQVRKKKHPATPHDEAMALGEAALERDTKGMFRFNPGKQERVFPAYNAYTQERCRNCQLGGKETLGKDNSRDTTICQACRLIHECYEKGTADARISVQDVIRITSKPLDEQFHVVYEGQKGKVLQHEMVCATREDYNRVFKVAKAFADMFGDCRINPEILEGAPEARRIIYPDLPEDCKANPDLTTIFGYVDVKSPQQNTNCCKNANKASKEQHSCVCLTDDQMKIKKKQKEKISERQINDRSDAIWNSPDYHYDYLFWFINGVMRKLERPSDKKRNEPE